MATTTETERSTAGAALGASKGAGARLGDPAYQGYLILWAGFSLAPVLFGIDKFFNWMVEWPHYLWTWIPDTLGIAGSTVMYIVGGIEIVAGVLVFLRPRYAAYVVTAWLGGIIVNLVAASIDGPFRFYDVALRDFGLMLGALALARLATHFSPSGNPLTGD